MRYFLTRRHPPMTRILLIESGSRSLIERVIPSLRAVWGPETPIDLVTCYAALPEGFDERGVVYRVADYGSPQGRRQLIGLLRGRQYALAGMVCSAEPIMTKWKWLIALRVPAKFFIINENADYFWISRENAGIIRQFALIRMGLAGSGALRAIGRLLIFPFSVIFLLLYAFAAHSGRILRGVLKPSKT
jgi:hypothetical protein